MTPAACLAAGAIAALAFFAVVPGCATDPKTRVQDSIPYDGPPITIDADGPTKQVVMLAPTSGWSFTLDRVDEAPAGREAYVTVRGPNPAMIYTQALVEQRIGTGVPSSTPLRVLARVLEFTAQRDSGVYRPVVPAR